MQPYFLPYIGYWQMMHAVDEFVIYDDVQYSSGGWINRNRLLLGGEAKYFTLPLRKGSMRQAINERQLTENWDRARQNLINQIANAYAKAPQHAPVMQLVEGILQEPGDNLADFLSAALAQTAAYVGITTSLIRSSELGIRHFDTPAERVVAICDALQARRYVNLPGGRALYEKDDFRTKGVELCFIQSRPITYSQFEDAFVPNLSILDVMMFNAPETVRAMLADYELD